MSDLDNDVGSDEFPKVHQAVSLYYENVKENSDKEYHLQLVEVNPTLFNVKFQFGKRGSKLRDTFKMKADVSRWGAERVYTETQAEKLKEGYRPIDLTQLAGIYANMLDHQMNGAGVDLFMDRRGKYISMVEYAKQAGSAAEREFSQIAAYAAGRAAQEFLVKECGGPIDSRRVRDGLPVISRMLRSSGLENMGVFVGYADDGGQICKGIPAEHETAARLKM